MRELEQEYLDKFANDRYFTGIVEEFTKERTPENFVNTCKVLQYRDFYLAAVVEVNDHHYRAELKHTGTLPFEALQDKSKVIVDPIKAEIKYDGEIAIVLCIFTDPSKIDFKKIHCNGMFITNLEKVWKDYFADEELQGIVINLGEEEMIIAYDYIKYTLNGEFDKLEASLMKR